MTDVAALIADLVAAGTPAALVGRVAAALKAPSADDELSADRRGRDRDRKRIYREKTKAASAERPRTVPGTEPFPSPPPSPSPDKEIPPTPPKENNLFPEPPPQPRVSGAREFERFWQVFPNKVGKADASKAFDRAIRRVDIATMLDGLDRYVHKTDDRPWCNPSTWLNQDRWTDQPQAVARGSPVRRMSKVEELGEELRQEIGSRIGLRAQGREEGRALQPPQGLLAIGGKA